MQQAHSIAKKAGVEGILWVFSENSRKKFSLFQRKFVGLKSEKFLIMKLKKLFFVACNLFGVLSFAQVGINTTTPNAVLDIRATSATAPTNTDGLLIPKVDVFPATNPTAAQQGMLVYLTTVLS